jgi:hypothetical protein
MQGLLGLIASGFWSRRCLMIPRTLTFASKLFLSSFPHLFLILSTQMSYAMKPPLAVCFCLATLWSFATSQADLYTKYETPRRLSVDLLFPKNETYKPQYKFPIVFALDPVAFWPFNFTFYYRIVTRIPG